MKRAIDFEVENHWSLWLIRPLTMRARLWADEHLPEDGPRMGSAYVVEPRYVEDILAGVLDAGMAWGDA